MRINCAGTALAAIVLVPALAGFANSNTSEGSGDAARIYGAFLDKWAGEQKDPINVSIIAEAPPPEVLKEFSDCADENQWLAVEPIEDLASVIGNLTYVHLVDPDKWKPRDPADLIAQGQPVESAVASGFEGGLATFSAIAFNESRTTAAFTFSFVCGRLCGSGRTVVFNRTPDGWVESSKQCSGWMSQTPSEEPGNSFKPDALLSTGHRASHVVHVAGSATHASSVLVSG